MEKIEKIETSARLMMRSCSTCRRLAHGAIRLQAVM